MNKLKAGFPLNGENVINVGQQFSVHIDTRIVQDVNVFFIKGGVTIDMSVLSTEVFNNDNYSIIVKSFVIDSTHFSEEYLPCKIRIESSEVPTIYKESDVFKVLRG